MKTLPLMLIPLALAPAMVMAKPDARLLKVEPSKDEAGRVLIYFEAREACGAYASYSLRTENSNGKLGLVFSIHALACAKGEKPEPQKFVSSIHIPTEAARLGMTSDNPDLKIDINLNLK